MAFGHGGERDGAGRKARPAQRQNGGRKPKPKTRDEFNSHFDEAASKILPELFETMKTIAQGFKIAVYAEPRKVKAKKMVDEANEPIWVYTVPPDKAAAMYLIDRAAGKAAVKNPEAVDTELILQVGDLMSEDETEEPDAE